MSAITGIAAGVATLVGAVALTRYAAKRAKKFRDEIEKAARRANGEPTAVLEFERDPQTDVFRAKER